MAQPVSTLFARVPPPNAHSTDTDIGNESFAPDVDSENLSVDQSFMDFSQELDDNLAPFDTIDSDRSMEDADELEVLDTNDSNAVQAMETTPLAPCYEFTSPSMAGYSERMKALGQRGSLSQVRCIVARASTGIDVAELMSFCPLMTNVAMQLFLNVARLVLSTNQAQRRMLSSVLKVLLPFGLFGSDFASAVRIPTRPKEFRASVHNKSSNNSLINLVPVPASSEVEDDGHSHVSLVETIAHSFLSHKPTKSYQIHPRITDIVEGTGFDKCFPLSSRQYLVCPTPKVLCYVILWHDGWDPLSSKTNRKPVWTMTATVMYVNVGDSMEPYYHRTFVISMGPGKESHDSAFHNLIQDVKKMRCDESGENAEFTTYSIHHETTVTYEMAIGFHLADQPERRDSLGLLGGGSKVHKMFGVLCSFHLLEKDFVSCADCEAHNSLYLVLGQYDKSPCRTGCDSCYGWSITNLLNTGRYKKKVCNLKLAEGEHGQILLHHPHKITSHDIRAACKFADSKYRVNQVWSETQTKECLGLWGMRDERIKTCIKLSRNVVSAQQAEAQGSNPNPRLQAILDERELHPNLCQDPTCPPAFEIGEIADRVETPMHLMMGLVKATVRMVLSWSAKRNRKTHLLSRLKLIMGSLKELRLDFLDVIVIKDEKFGGCAAENYSVLSMIGPWLFCVLLEEEMLVGEGDFDPVPDQRQKKQKKWTKDENWAWLAKHNLPCPNLLKDELQKLVASCMKGNAMPDKYYDMGDCYCPLAAKIPAEDMLCLVVHMHNTFSCMFSTDLQGIQAAHRLTALAKEYLSALERIDKTLLRKRKQATWLAKCNCLGLLRCAEHFLTHCRIRSMHEGGDFGEGIVKDLRQMNNKTMRPGWAKHLVDKHNRSNMIDDNLLPVVKESVSSDDGSDDEVEQRDLRPFVRHKPGDDIESMFHNQSPVSVLVHRNENNGSILIGPMVVGHHNWCIAKLDLTDPNIPVDASRLHYHKVALSQDMVETVNTNSVVVHDHQLLGHGVMLPHLWREDNEGLYVVLLQASRKLDRDMRVTSMLGVAGPP